MQIYKKRGVWYVTEPDMPVKRFDSEEAALAYVNGVQQPDDLDSILDEDWEDDEE